MRKLVHFALIAFISLTSCSKNKDATTIPANTVSINGNNYSTVVIGNQTWTSTNYIGPGGVSYANSSLYTLAQAVSVTLPSGWRLPTEVDFNNLMTLAGGTKDGYGYITNGNPFTLMSKVDWDGTNSLGFDAIPTGFAFSPGPLFEGIGVYALFWSSSSDTPGEPLTLVIQHIPANAPSVVLNKLAPSDYASLRFVKDN